MGEALNSLYIAGVTCLWIPYLLASVSSTPLTRKGEGEDNNVSFSKEV